MRLRITSQTPFGLYISVGLDGLGIDWRAQLPLGMKLKSLGAQTEDLNILLHAARRRVSIAAHDNVIREGETTGHVRVLLVGATCSYKRKEDGARSIFSF